ncbi:MAG: sulfatase, partial [Planctomycetaceae bacterium]
MRPAGTLTQLLLTILLLMGMNTAVQARNQPNILFVFADDWGRYASAYGKLEPGTVNDIVKTPVFDQLAAEGALMTRAFV